MNENDTLTNSLLQPTGNASAQQTGTNPNLQPMQFGGGESMTGQPGNMMRIPAPAGAPAPSAGGFTSKPGTSMMK